MPATAIVNLMTVVHKGSNGIAMTFPDVCKTPSPAGPIPIPYPNVAMSSDTASGSSTVKVDGNPIMTKASHYSLSTGDEAGSAQGVVSNKIKGKAYPKLYSFDVKVDGDNVFRLLDIMLQNGGSPTNTPPGPNLQPPNVSVALTKDPDEMKVTAVKWDQTESCCGDEVKLTVETEKMDGLAVLIAAVRNAQRLKTVGLIGAPIAGNKSNPSWLARRGPHEASVKLKGMAGGLGGPKTSSNELEVKGVADVPEEIFSEQRTAYGMVWQFVPGYGDCWLGKKVYGWDVTYGRKIEKGVLIVTKKVQFAPKPHVTTKKKPGTITGKQREKWKREVETVWDNKLRLHRTDCKRGDTCDCSSCGGCSFPIRVFCEWGSGHGKAVSLFPGGPQSTDWGKTDLWWYSHTWWEEQGGAGSAAVRAHEFGHLIGMYDEYAEGAVNPAAHGSKVVGDKRVRDGSSIMGSGTAVYARHFEELQAWFQSKAEATIGKTKLISV